MDLPPKVHNAGAVKPQPAALAPRNNAVISDSLRTLNASSPMSPANNPWTPSPVTWEYHAATSAPGFAPSGTSPPQTQSIPTASSTNYLSTEPTSLPVVY